MRHLASLVVIILASLNVGCACCQAPAPTGSSATLGSLRHVVVFKFKDGTPPGKVNEIVEAFGGLKAKIPQITGFEWGLNNSPEGKDQGFTHVFLVTFADAKGREAYLPHPEHEKFKALVGPHLAGVYVVDYYAKD